MQDYIKDAEKIQQQSFAIVRKQINLTKYPASMHSLIIRMVSSCGMTDLIDDIYFQGDVVENGIKALRQRNPILTDCQMLKSAIRKNIKSDVICTIDEVKPMKNHTRSAKAVDKWTRYMKNSIIAIGNAPTALFRLLELLSEGAPLPYLIIASPPGFVGATEAKELLIKKSTEKSTEKLQEKSTEKSCAYLTVRGKKGGSAIAAAALNAIIEKYLNNPLNNLNNPLNNKGK